MKEFGCRMLGEGFALEFLLCFLYTVISIANFVASYIDK